MAPIYTKQTKDPELAELTPIRVSQKPCCVDDDTYDHESDKYDAIDKNLKTRAMARAGEDGPAWFRIEFDSPQFVHKIKFYNKFFTNWFRPDNRCVKCDEKWKMCIDGDTNIDISVYQGSDTETKSCGTLEFTYDLEQSGQIYTLICNAEGDSLVLSKTSGELKIYEIVVIGKGW